MIKTKQRLSRFMLTLFTVLVMFCAVSCDKQKENEEDISSIQDAVTSIVNVAAKPGVGVGRVMNKAAEPNGIIICIDPGHGFIDGGAGEGILPDGILEKDINLSIANKLSEDLIQLGYTTILTHDGVNLPDAAIYDQIFNANERAAYANSITMDYFISIHVNSAQNSDAEGARIYYYDNSIKVNPIGGTVAELMGKAIEENMPEDLDPIIVDQSEDPKNSYAVCRDIKYPSSLVEIGFCTNENDAEKMIRDDWQERFAQSLANGINEYFTKYAK